MSDHRFALPAPLPRVVVGRRVRLELWDVERVDEVRALVARSRTELAAFLPWAVAPLTDEDERRVQSESAERWRQGLQAGWALLEDGVLRGMVGLHRRGGPHELEIGYWLGTEATGRGLMTEAASMAVDVAFDVEVVEVVEVVHDAANLRSGAVPRRLGFSRVAAYTAEPAALRETGLKVRWQVRREDWLARGAPRAALSTEP